MVLILWGHFLVTTRYYWPLIQLRYTGIENILWTTCLENKVWADYLWSTWGLGSNWFRSILTVASFFLLLGASRFWTWYLKLSTGRLYYGTATVKWSLLVSLINDVNQPKECAVYISKSKHNSSQMVIKFPRVNTDEFDSRLLRLFMSRY